MRSDSREIHPKVEMLPTELALDAKRRNDTPITMQRKTRMNMPRVGSDAKA